MTSRPISPQASPRGIKTLSIASKQSPGYVPLSPTTKNLHQPNQFDQQQNNTNIHNNSNFNLMNNNNTNNNSIAAAFSASSPVAGATNNNSSSSHTSSRRTTIRPMDVFEIGGGEEIVIDHYPNNNTTNNDNNTNTTSAPHDMPIISTITLPERKTREQLAEMVNGILVNSGSKSLREPSYCSHAEFQAQLNSLSDDQKWIAYLRPHYVVLSRLGKGGYGSVFRARPSTSLDLISPSSSAETGGATSTTTSSPRGMSPHRSTSSSPQKVNNLIMSDEDTDIGGGANSHQHQQPQISPRKSSGHHVAIKVIDRHIIPTSQSRVKHLAVELAVLQLPPHSNVNHRLGLFHTKDHILVVLELCEAPRPTVFTRLAHCMSYRKPSKIGEIDRIYADWKKKFLASEQWQSRLPSWSNSNSNSSDTFHQHQQHHEPDDVTEENEETFAEFVDKEKLFLKLAKELQFPIFEKLPNAKQGVSPSKKNDKNKNSNNKGANNNNKSNNNKSSPQQQQPQQPRLIQPIEIPSSASLFHIIQGYKRISDSMSRVIMKQILTGLKTLHHRHKVVHRDLKTENIVLAITRTISAIERDAISGRIVKIRFDEKVSVKIVDFGLAKYFLPSSSSSATHHHHGAAGSSTTTNNGLSRAVSESTFFTENNSLATSSSTMFIGGNNNNNHTDMHSPSSSIPTQNTSYASFHAGGGAVDNSNNNVITLSPATPQSQYHQNHQEQLPTIQMDTHHHDNQNANNNNNNNNNNSGSCFAPGAFQKDSSTTSTNDGSRSGALSGGGGGAPPMMVAETQDYHSMMTKTSTSGENNNNNNNNTRSGSMMLLRRGAEKSDLEGSSYTRKPSAAITNYHQSSNNLQVTKSLGNELTPGNSSGNFENAHNSSHDMFKHVNIDNFDIPPSSFGRNPLENNPNNNDDDDHQNNNFQNINNNNQEGSSAAFTSNFNSTFDCVNNNSISSIHNNNSNNQQQQTQQLQYLGPQGFNQASSSPSFPVVSTPTGTDIYLALEALRGIINFAQLKSRWITTNKSLYKLDVYGVGAMLFFMSNGKPPFVPPPTYRKVAKEVRMQQLEKLVADGPKFLQCVSSYTRNFALKMMENDLDKRYSVRKALEDAYVKDVEGDSLVTEIGISGVKKITVYDSKKKRTQEEEEEAKKKAQQIVDAEFGEFKEEHDGDDDDDVEANNNVNANDDDDDDDDDDEQQEQHDEEEEKGKYFDENGEYYEIGKDSSAEEDELNELRRLREDGGDAAGKI